jgi:hypothetical protein
MILEPIVLFVSCVNLAAVLVGAVRCTACTRNERAFWRAYDARCASENPAGGLAMRGHCP